VLEAMPDLNMIVYLPTLLEGLFRILSDPNLEIRRMCEGLLGEFLRKVDSPRVTNFQVCGCGGWVDGLVDGCM
jgi:vacuole morphology and inheritance protein 14